MTNSMVRRNGAAPMQRQASTGVDTIAALLKKHGPEIALALPQHVTPERLLRIALSEVRRNPKLGKCSAPSLLAAVFTCAQLGLEPGGPLGHAFLIPYGDECQFQIGYKGMIDLARRSGQIKSVSARCVYTNDAFSYSFGLDEDLKHVPAVGDRGELTHVYAVARLIDGGVQFEVMDRFELEDIRDSSQGYKMAVKYNKKDTPWISAFDEMCRKTVIRRLFKYLPVSVEVAKAASLDESGDRGHRQESDLDHILLPAETSTPPELAAAATPVATMTEQQLQILATGLGRQLTPVGAAAFWAESCAAYGVQEPSQIPAEHHSVLMGLLADAGRRQRWDRGCASETGEPILSAEHVAALTPEAAEPEPVNEAPPAAATRAPAPVRQQAPRAAATAQQQAPAAVDEAAAEVQAELV